MNAPRPAADAAAIAAESLSLLGSGRQTEPWSARHAGFDLDLAYAAAASVRAARVARGERPVGRKIGFTNRTIWPEYGVWQPIWGDVWDSTLRELPPAAPPFPLAGFAEPRIEPEIVFGLAAAPRAGMDVDALMGCIDWVAHGFEIVQSIFPDWKFTAADTVAGYGLHGALLLGPKHRIAPGDRARWRDALASFEIELACDGEVRDRGRAANVLDGPLHALAHLVAGLAERPDQPPLAAGEVVTTGTLTRALPIAPAQTWTTRFTGLPIDGLMLRTGGDAGAGGERPQRAQPQQQPR